MNSPGKIRCEFCHEWVDPGRHRAHVREHLRLRPDGQQQEYVTLPPEERYEGPLDGVPRVYRHLRCGSVTGMPEEIIRSYLQDPFTYWADRTYCSGCRSHVPCREIVWVETGENMQAYNDRLRGRRPSRSGRGSGTVRPAVLLIARALLYLVIIGLAGAAILGWLAANARGVP